MSINAVGGTFADDMLFIDNVRIGAPHGGALAAATVDYVGGTDMVTDLSDSANFNFTTGLAHFNFPSTEFPYIEDSGNQTMEINVETGLVGPAQTNPGELFHFRIWPWFVKA